MYILVPYTTFTMYECMMPDHHKMYDIKILQCTCVRWRSDMYTFLGASGTGGRADDAAWLLSGARWPGIYLYYPRIMVK